VGDASHAIVHRAVRAGPYPQYRQLSTALARRERLFHVLRGPRADLAAEMRVYVRVVWMLE
jgi:hypothetical protein